MWMPRPRAGRDTRASAQVSQKLPTDTTPTGSPPRACPVAHRCVLGSIRLTLCPHGSWKARVGRRDPWRSFPVRTPELLRNVPVTLVRSNGSGELHRRLCCGRRPEKGIGPCLQERISPEERGLPRSPAWPHWLVLLAARRPASLSPACGPSTARATSPAFGPLNVSQDMGAGTSGSLVLGGDNNKFIGTCNLAGTIPAGWSVEELSGAVLSAAPGSGNAGRSRGTRRFGPRRQRGAWHWGR